MNRAFPLIALIACFTLLVADTKIALNHLPSAVQAAAKAQANGAQIVAASKEIKRGRVGYNSTVTYEATIIMKNGRHAEAAVNACGSTRHD